MGIIRQLDVLKVAEVMIWRGEERSLLSAAGGGELSSGMSERRAPIVAPRLPRICGAARD